MSNLEPQKNRLLVLGYYRTVLEDPFNKYMPQVLKYLTMAFADHIFGNFIVTGFKNDCMLWNQLQEFLAKNTQIPSRNLRLKCMYQEKRTDLNGLSLRGTCMGSGKVLMMLQDEFNDIYGGFRNTLWDDDHDTKHDANAFIWKYKKNELHKYDVKPEMAGLATCFSYHHWPNWGFGLRFFQHRSLGLIAHTYAFSGNERREYKIRAGKDSLIRNNTGPFAGPRFRRQAYVAKVQMFEIYDSRK